jgi:glucan phosphoethanolaminetransferase (alkaline phosphatase superfamily)
MADNIFDPRLVNLIYSFLKLIFGLALFITLIILIYQGILYITGSKEGIKKIHSRWYLILIGVVLIFLSLTIPRLISMFFK